MNTNAHKKMKQQMNLGKIEIGPIPRRKLDRGWPKGSWAMLKFEKQDNGSTQGGFKLAESWTILEPTEVGQLANPKKNEVGPNPGRKLDNE